MEWEVPLFKTYSDEDDVDAVTEVIERGTYWATGPEIEDFEEEVADYVGADYALAMNSGTTALQAILMAEGIDSGEIIVPSFSFVATANVVLLSGARPVFADIEEKTYGLDPESVREKITEDTKAIMPMHYGGRTSEGITELREIADEKDILLIEDAAESLGSELQGKKAGTIGHVGMFSLCQNKVISTGEGGIVVTDSEQLYEKLKLVRSHGRVNSREGEYFSSLSDSDYVRPGSNFRMSTISAALGKAQMEKIDQNISMRQENAKKLNERLSKIQDLRVPKNTEEERMVYQMYTVECKDRNQRDKLQEHLKEAGIMTKTYWATPIHEKSLYADKDTRGLETTERICGKVLTLPMFPEMSEKQIEKIATEIREFYDS